MATPTGKPTKKKTTARKTPVRATARTAKKKKASAVQEAVVKAITKPDAVAPVRLDEKMVAIRKGELAERIAVKSGLKKRDARLAAEAAISVITAALEAGETIVIPQVAKLMPIKRRALAQGAVVTAKIRIKGAADATPEAAE